MNIYIYIYMYIFRFSHFSEIIILVFINSSLNDVKYEKNCTYNIDNTTKTVAVSQSSISDRQLLE